MRHAKEVDYLLYDLHPPRRAVRAPADRQDEAGAGLDPFWSARCQACGSKAVRETFEGGEFKVACKEYLCGRRVFHADRLTAYRLFARPLMMEEELRRAGLRQIERILKEGR